MIEAECVKQGGERVEVFEAFPQILEVFKDVKYYQDYSETYSRMFVRRFKEVDEIEQGLECYHYLINGELYEIFLSNSVEYFMLSELKSESNQMTLF